MKNKILFLGLLFSIISFSGVSYASDYADINTEKKTWIMSIGREIEQKFKKAVENAVDDFFEEQMYRVLGEAIGESIGKAFADSLSGFISIGPFFSVTDVLGLGSRSESQIMMQIILEAIEEAKEEIISAVDQVDRAEVIARLETIKNALITHNARSLPGRKAEYGVLWDLKTGAEFVRQRIESRPQTIISDLHYYVLMSSMQIAMEKEYTYWLMYHNEDPDFDFDNDIENEIRGVVGTIVSSVNSGLLSPEVGNIGNWRNSFKDLFGNRSTIQYARPISSSDDMSGLGSYSHDRSGFFRYKMGDSGIEFLVLNRSCLNGSFTMFHTRVRYVSYKYSVYDASGKYIGDVSGTRTPSTCNQFNAGNSVVLQELRSKDIINTVINRHRNDELAFIRYLIDGYGPVKKAIDTWWPEFRVAERPKSEVDFYFDSYIEGQISDLCLMSSGRDVDWDGLDGFVKFDFSVANCGYTDLIDVNVSVANEPDEGMADPGLNGFQYESDFCPDGVTCACSGNSCSFSALDREDAISLSVVLSESLWHSGEVVVRAEALNDEISYRNNKIAVGEVED